jgi:hypothetical protein
MQLDKLQTESEKLPPLRSRKLFLLIDLESCKNEAGSLQTLFDCLFFETSRPSIHQPGEVA